MIHRDRLQNAAVWLRPAAGPLFQVVEPHKVAPSGRNGALPPFRCGKIAGAIDGPVPPTLSPNRLVDGCIRVPGLAGAVMRPASITKRALSPLFARARGHKAAYHAV